MSRDPSALKAALSWLVFARADFDTPKVEHVSVFLNDNYLGLFLLHETITQDFFAAQQVDVRSIYPARLGLANMRNAADAPAAFASRVEPENYSYLKRLITLVNGPSTTTNRTQLRALLELDEVARYMAAAVRSDHQDGCNNNFILYRTTKPQHFHIFPWDLDDTFRGLNSRAGATLLNDNAMMQRIRDDDELTEAAYECALDELNERLTAEEMIDEVHAIADSIESAFIHDRVLSQGERSLPRHVEELSKQFRAQLEKLRSQPSQCP